ncbi:MAG: hypothetical protein WCI03_10545 [bacterium]|jgi:hypothetical protein
MKLNNPSLTGLWSAAGIALLIGVLLSAHTLGDIRRTSEIWNKKTNDLHEMVAMRTTAAEHQRLLNHYGQYPTGSTSLGELARAAVPGLALITRSTETHPSVPGWTARKISLGIVDISGDDLGRFIEATSTASPPWAVLDCTASASPASGRLAKVELVLETVEK